MPSDSASTDSWVPMCHSRRCPAVLPRVSKAFRPTSQPPRWASGVLLGNAAQQQDGLGQHQFGHRTGVGEGGVEHRHAPLHARPSGPPGWCRCRSSRWPPACGAHRQHLGGELGARADAHDEVHVLDANKQKALDAALAQIERQFGKGSTVMRMGDRTQERFRPSRPDRSGWTSRWVSAACRVAGWWRSTGRNLPARPR
jgi:hypothetical protein